VLAILGGAFFSGMSRTIASIVAVYLAAIVAGSFYDDLTDLVRRWTDMGETTGQLCFFVLLFLLFTLAFTFVISRWLEGVRVPRWLGVLDRLRGTALGLLVAGAAVTVAAMLLSILVQALQQVALTGQAPLGDIVEDQVEGSALVPLFLRLSPYFLRLVEPWFPGGLPRLMDYVA
jgi:uncharacterized membrane protein required for colicin V production